MSGSRRRRGFTFIETIASIVILSVAIPPMLWAIRAAEMHRVNATLPSRARWLVTEKLEDIVADRHGPSRGWSYVKNGGNYTDEVPVATDTQFNRRVTVSEHGPWDDVGSAWTAGTSYLTVTVQVEWYDSGGTLRTISIETILTDY